MYNYAVFALTNIIYIYIYIPTILYIEIPCISYRQNVPIYHIYPKFNESIDIYRNSHSDFVVHVSVRYACRYVAIEREAINQQSYLRIPSSLQNCRDKHTITNDTRIHPFHPCHRDFVPFLTSNTFTTCLRWLMWLYVCVFTYRNCGLIWSRQHKPYRTMA